MKKIIDPVPVELIKSELTEDKKLRDTNKCHNEIYIVTWQNAPNVVREIGRLREIAFRAYGGGSGEEIDLDSFDTCDNPYKQLIVWDPESEKILGGYRYICGPDIKIDANGQPILATSHMFHFTEKFVKEYLPYTIELGRSFVTLEYQSTRESGAKALFTLDNLWDGLGAISIMRPDMEYFFGKFTMYPDYNRHARNCILTFLKKHFQNPEEDKLVIPVDSMLIKIDEAEEREILQEYVETDFKADYKILNGLVRKEGVNIPPLVNAYMGLSPTMKFFGTAINEEFGDVEESAILIKISDIRSEKVTRHFESFIPTDYLMFNLAKLKQKRELRRAIRKEKRIQRRTERLKRKSERIAKLEARINARKEE